MRSAALGVVLLLAAVSGCSSGDAEPAEVRPLASGSASADEPTTGPKPPSDRGDSRRPGEARLPEPMPSAALAADSAGASEFARHYIATLQNALNTGETRALDLLSHQDCGGCNNLLLAIEEATNAGHRVRGAELIVEFSEAPQVRNAETIVDLRYRRTAGELIDTDGKVIQAIEGEGRTDTQMRVKYSGRTWSVLGFRQVSG